MRRLAVQLVHFFALMLWVAAVLAFLAGMPRPGVALIAVVVLNAAFAFVQEGRAPTTQPMVRPSYYGFQEESAGFRRSCPCGEPASPVKRLTGGASRG
ncbi:MAG: hypothetical protein ACKOBG_02865 [Actinomycetota bacterium]